MVSSDGTMKSFDQTDSSVTDKVKQRGSWMTDTEF